MCIRDRLGDVSNSSSISEIAIDKIEPNPDQPRTHFDPESLEELAASIRALGIVQPITVRELTDGRHLIISGERRWRASKLANLTSIPAYIVKADDEKVVEMALIENIQREALNAIEIALTYKRLLEHSEGTQEELAKKAVSYTHLDVYKRQVILSGTLSPKFSYLYRQRLSSINLDRTFFESIDFLYLQYNPIEQLSIRLGKWIRCV